MRMPSPDLSPVPHRTGVLAMAHPPRPIEDSARSFGTAAAVTVLRNCPELEAAVSCSHHPLDESNPVVVK